MGDVQTFVMFTFHILLTFLFYIFIACCLNNAINCHKGPGMVTVLAHEVMMLVFYK